MLGLVSSSLCGRSGLFIKMTLSGLDTKGTYVYRGPLNRFGGGGNVLLFTVFPPIGRHCSMVWGRCRRRGWQLVTLEVDPQTVLLSRIEKKQMRILEKISMRMRIRIHALTELWWAKCWYNKSLKRQLSEILIQFLTYIDRPRPENELPIVKFSEDPQFYNKHSFLCLVKEKAVLRNNILQKIFLKLAEIFLEYFSYTINLFLKAIY
jgi:hypothetical protein